MRLEHRAVHDALGMILLHNIAHPSGEQLLRKGTRLAAEHLARLEAAGFSTIEVAVLEPDDVHEDEAAQTLALALQTANVSLSRPDGGRVNLKATVDGLVEISVERLLQLNLIPGIALATRRQHTVAGPHQDTDNVATLKIVPFAIHRRLLELAVRIAGTRPGILEIRPFQANRPVALLLVGDASVQPTLREQYLPATAARLERLCANLIQVEAVEMTEPAIASAAARLAGVADLLIIAGQTSIMDENDTILRALQMAGAELGTFGAPVEPGNLLALAYLPGAPVLCVPGCGKSLKHNGIDLVLPRLLLGDRLDRRDIAALGLGGFLTAAERSGEGA